MRWAHFYHPLLFGLWYTFFNMSYYYAGGEGIGGNRLVYKVLDWANPGQAAILIFLCLGLTIVFHLVTYTLYHARLVAYELSVYRAVGADEYLKRGVKHDGHKVYWLVRKLTGLSPWFVRGHCQKCEQLRAAEAAVKEHTAEEEYEHTAGQRRPD